MPLNGPIEADETFIGGKETNKHKHKKLNAGNMQEFVGAYAGEDAKLYTDESAAYKAGSP